MNREVATMLDREALQELRDELEAAKEDHKSRADRMWAEFISSCKWAVPMSIVIQYLLAFAFKADHEYAYMIRQHWAWFTPLGLHMCLLTLYPVYRLVMALDARGFFNGI